MKQFETIAKKDKNTAAAKNTSDGNDDDFIVPDDQFDSSDYLRNAIIQSYIQTK